MIFSVHTSLGIPIYLQIVQQVKHRVAVGALRPGDRLPSVREVAEQLRINPNTVAKAFAELEHQGIVETRRGSGTFVAESGSTLSRAERRRLVRKACEHAAGEAYNLAWQPEDLKAIFNECVDAVFKNRQEGDNNAA